METHLSYKNTSRNDARYERRSRKREQIKRGKQRELSYENQILNRANWYDAVDKCKRNVFWKLSVQKYMFNPILNVEKNIGYVEKFVNGEVDNVLPINTTRIDIWERGKKRVITPINIRRRHLEHVLCDNILMPMFKGSIIYDNAASQPGKGTDFARKRFMEHLSNEVQTYGGDNVYILQYDFKSFFPSIPQDGCYKLLDKTFDDKRLVKLFMDSINDYLLGNIKNEKDPEQRAILQKQFDEGKGIGLSLGSQLSQTMAIVYPSVIDHYIKDKRRFKHYVRYMDDGIIIYHDKEVLNKLKSEIEEIANGIGLSFNEKKTRVQKATKQFTFLKTKYRIVGDKIIRIPSNDSIKRCRRKLKKFKGLVKSGKMTYDDVFISFQCTYNHLKKVGKSYKSRKRLLTLYCQLFGCYRLKDIKF